MLERAKQVLAGFFFSVGVLLAIPPLAFILLALYIVGLMR